jgi:hypothetical protein
MQTSAGSKFLGQAELSGTHTQGRPHTGSGGTTPRAEILRRQMCRGGSRIELPQRARVLRQGGGGGGCVQRNKFH